MNNIKEIPIFFVSEKTGNEYDYNLYINHGKGGIYKGKLDLPLDEYPYYIKYNKELLYKWKN